MIICRCLLIILISLFLSADPAAAHPEDEFCVAGQGVDPDLCRALQEIDRAGGAPSDNRIALVRTPFETLLLYIRIGIAHILPFGLDHILFVLALAIAARRLTGLMLQISVFTLAHSATLGLVASGVLAPPASIVEPLIALSIAALAIEMMFFPDPTRWRLALIFIFGLIHGMGFAGFFGSLGLPEGQFWSALIGFNLGVELGQIFIVLCAVLMLWPARSRLTDRVYQRWIVIPNCAMIALIALYWTSERILV